MDDPHDRDTLYRTVICEATDENDPRRYLREDLLKELWPRLTIPRHVRRLWESRHPALVAREKRIIAASSAIDVKCEA